ncbi:hypothetical protein ICN41_11275, partial [Polynucleobacter sp. 15G-AUS-farblos]|uniref:hypothetical protein n=1 Tax=Polynucleobacter sp. 15G-AUS-farblos TaxID=2689094 RepID=UPI001C0C375D
FNRARLDDAQAADLLARLSQLIEALPVIAKTPLAAIPLTTLSERTALIASSAGPVVDLDLQAPALFNLPSLFAAQVAK